MLLTTHETTLRLPVRSTVPLASSEGQWWQRFLFVLMRALAVSNA